VYNHAAFVARCLRSIIRQSTPPAKLLVIDDGSTDGSAAVIEATLKESPFDCEMIVRENRGLCATLNQGLELSRGKYFAYLGSDDLWLPAFLEERRQMLERRPAAALGYGHAFYVDEEDRVFDWTVVTEGEIEPYSDGDVKEMLMRVTAPISSTVFYRRSALEGLEWNVHSRLEDFEMYLKLMPRGQFAFDPQILSAWRRHGNNTSHDRSMMAAEVVGALERNRDNIGFDGTRLEQIKAAAVFGYARQQLQFGHKAAAARLAVKSWRGASSPAAIARFAARMLIPMALIEKKRRGRAERFAARFGRLDD
jgi:alpha-1,3-rhamnosyltransferase